MVTLTALHTKLYSLIKQWDEFITLDILRNFYLHFYCNNFCS